MDSIVHVHSNPLHNPFYNHHVLPLIMKEVDFGYLFLLLQVSTHIKLWINENISKDDKQIRVISKIFQSGCYDLDLICIRGQLDVLKIIHKHNRLDKDTFSKYVWREHRMKPLHYTIDKGHVEMVKWIVTHFDVLRDENQLYHDGDLSELLKVSVQSDQVEIFTLLIELFDLEHQPNFCGSFTDDDGFGITTFNFHDMMKNLFKLAIRSKSFNIVQWCVEHQRSYVDISDKTLLFLMENNLDHILIYLLEQFPDKTHAYHVLLTCLSRITPNLQ